MGYLREVHLHIPGTYINTYIHKKHICIRMHIQHIQHIQHTARSNTILIVEMGTLYIGTTIIFQTHVYMLQ